MRSQSRKCIRATVGACIWTALPVVSNQLLAQLGILNRTAAVCHAQLRQSAVDQQHLRRHVADVQIDQHGAGQGGQRGCQGLRMTQLRRWPAARSSRGCKVASTPEPGAVTAMHWPGTSAGG